MQPYLLLLAAVVLAVYAWSQLAPTGLQSLLERLGRGAAAPRPAVVARKTAAAPALRHGQTQVHGAAPALDVARLRARVEVGSHCARAWLIVGTLLGLGVAVWWAVRRSRRYAFVLLALVMAMLPGLVSVNPNGNRGAAPPQ